MATNNCQRLHVDDELACFVEYMIDEQGWTAKNIVEFLASPWKWEREFERWSETGDCRDAETIREENKATAAETKWESNR